MIGGERAIQGERMILRLAMAVERVFEWGGGDDDGSDVDAAALGRVGCCSKKEKI